MFKTFQQRIVWGILSAFLVNSWGPAPLAQAQSFVQPAPGMDIPRTSSMVKGLTIHPDNPLQFDLIVEPNMTVGAGLAPAQDRLRDESLQMIKYFLASLTTPEDQMWVNLSPYEKNRIIPESFGTTLMGRDLLAQDYILKQMTASLIHPDTKLGQEFWTRVYAQAKAQYGTDQIPVNTFNKVWIMPDKATVWEHNNSVFVIERHLRVMLEQDYVTQEKHAENMVGAPFTGAQNIRAGASPAPTIVNDIASQIVRDIIIPELTREVNDGAHFAQLRQIYNAMILATWYKTRLKDSLLGTVYVDKNKTTGIQYKNGTPKDIYQQYLQTFKKGVFNFIKEEPDPATGQMIPRKYFSGGAEGLRVADLATISGPLHRLPDSAQAALPTNRAMKVTFDAAMSTTLSADKAMQVDPPELERQIKFLEDPDNTVRLPALTAIGIYLNRHMDQDRTSVIGELIKKYRQTQNDPDTLFKEELMRTIIYSGILIENVQAFVEEELESPAAVGGIMKGLSSVAVGAQSSEFFDKNSFIEWWWNKTKDFLYSKNEEIVSAVLDFLLSIPYDDEVNKIPIVGSSVLAQRERLRTLAASAKFSDVRSKAGEVLMTYGPSDETISYSFEGRPVRTSQKIKAVEPYQLIQGFLNEEKEQQRRTILALNLALFRGKEDQTQLKTLLEEIITKGEFSYVALPYSESVRPFLKDFIEGRRVDGIYDLLGRPSQADVDIEQTRALLSQLYGKVGFIFYGPEGEDGRIGQDDARRRARTITQTKGRILVLGNDLMAGAALLRKNGWHQASVGQQIIHELGSDREAFVSIFVGDESTDFINSLLDPLVISAPYSFSSFGMRIQGSPIEDKNPNSREFLEDCTWGDQYRGVVVLRKEEGSRLREEGPVLHWFAPPGGVPANAAMSTPPAADKAIVANDLGGIDMNSRWLDLNVKRDGQGVPLPASLQDWAQIHIEGVEPVIVRMEPVNLVELIGT